MWILLNLDLLRPPIIHCRLSFLIDVDGYAHDAVLGSSMFSQRETAHYTNIHQCETIAVIRATAQHILSVDNDL